MSTDADLLRSFDIFGITVPFDLVFFTKVQNTDAIHPFCRIIILC